VEGARENATAMAKELADNYPNTSLTAYKKILDKYVDMPNAAYAVILSVDRNLSFPIYNEDCITGDMPENIFVLKDVKDYKFERQFTYETGDELYEISVPVIISRTFYKELNPRRNIVVLSEKETEKYNFPEFVDQMTFVVKYAVTFRNVGIDLLLEKKIQIPLFIVIAVVILAMIYRYEEYLVKPLAKLIMTTRSLEINKDTLQEEINRNDELGILSKAIFKVNEKFKRSTNNLSLTNDYAQSLIASSTISSLFNTVLFEILRLKEIEKGGLMYWNEKRERFVIKETKNFNDIHKSIGNDRGFIRWFLENQTVLEPEHFVKNFYNYNKEEAQRWKQYGIELIIPMFEQDKIVGLITLGRTENQKEYTEEDIDFFKSLAQVSVIAVENLNLRLREAQNLIIKKDLNFARDVQRKLLPDNVPAIKGVEFAVKASPARNIGGDYYDFIPLVDNIAGICIADVSGKGVSAALVMASTRSYLRLTAKENYDCSDILHNLNTLLIKDTNKKMFVTMFYSILNTNNNELSFANAGHNYPLIYKAKEKKSVYVEATGFPLGMIEDFKYVSSDMKFESGDMLVYYTDGVVEAVNEKKELFGFERLEDILNKHGSLGAKDFLTNFMKEFKRFIGIEDLNDDYTIIAMKIV
jgi:serine phosphatase RsbU (regulator of sigma subunit)